MRFVALLLSHAIMSRATTLLASAWNATSFALPHRQLQDDGISDFVPLTCNANLASASCTPWTSIFGTAASYPSSNRLGIPCGQCVTMDLAGGRLDLFGGLDVFGKLVFPDGYKVLVNSPIIAVQGELVMTSTKPVDGTPDVKFTMIGDSNMTLTPIDTNAKKCNGSTTCAVGKKAIVVAGGKVTCKFQVTTRTEG